VRRAASSIIQDTSSALPPKYITTLAAPVPRTCQAWRRVPSAASMKTLSTAERWAMAARRASGRLWGKKIRLSWTRYISKGNPMTTRPVSCKTASKPDSATTAKRT
jgi:hypothetical protein